MLDGVIEAHTAAMLEPYSDDPTQIGKLFWEPAKYKAAIAELDRADYKFSPTPSAINRFVLPWTLIRKPRKPNHTSDAASAG